LATLCRPSRGPLRALARQSGALTLLLKGPPTAEPPPSPHWWDADAEPTGALGGAQGERARLILVGPPPVLRRARELVYAWLQAEGGPKAHPAR